MLSRQERLHRREKSRRILKWIIIAGLSLVIIFLIVQIYHRTVESITRHNREIVEARTGFMEKTCQADAVILNDEKTYYAPGEGYFENSIYEGEKVRNGSEAGSFVPVNGNRVTVNVPATGIYTQHTDGLEKVFENTSLIEPGPDTFEYQIKVYGQDGHYYEGDPVFTIINNIKPAEMLVHISEKSPQVIHKDDNLVLRYKDVELGQARVQKIQYLDHQYYLYLKCQEYNQLLTKYRNIALTIVFDHKEGIIIPAQALKIKDEEKGVYCIKDEEIYFKPVKILEKQNSLALVKGLDNNEMVVVNAGP